MKRRFLTFLGLSTLVAVASGSSAHARPVVVELFTSQGCSSCPPAEMYLSKLASRDDVLPLAYHVTYWDYIGWEDPFGREEFNKRQTIYQIGWGKRSNYTPQMVIDGRNDVVGSQRNKAEKLIARAQSEKVDVPINVKLVKDKITISLPKDAAGTSDAPADVWLVAFDEEAQTLISRGENAGRRLNSSNVVRYFEHAGTWKGEADEISMNSPWTEDNKPWKFAVLLQQPQQGPIIGATVVEAAAAGNTGF